MGAQEAQLPASAEVAAANIQNLLTGLVVKGLKVKAQLLHLGACSAAGDAGQGGIHTVGRCAAHQSHHQAGGLVPQSHKRMIHSGSS